MAGGGEAMVVVVDVVVVVSGAEIVVVEEVVGKVEVVVVVVVSVLGTVEVDVEVAMAVSVLGPAGKPCVLLVVVVSEGATVAVTASSGVSGASGIAGLLFPLSGEQFAASNTVAVMAIMTIFNLRFLPNSQMHCFQSCCFLRFEIFQNQLGKR